MSSHPLCSGSVICIIMVDLKIYILFVLELFSLPVCVDHVGELSGTLLSKYHMIYINFRFMDTRDIKSVCNLTAKTNVTILFSCQCAVNADKLRSFVTFQP